MRQRDGASLQQSTMSAACTHLVGRLYPSVTRTSPVRQLPDAWHAVARRGPPASMMATDCLLKSLRDSLVVFTMASHWIFVMSPSHSATTSFRDGSYGKGDLGNPLVSPEAAAVSFSLVVPSALPANLSLGGDLGSDSVHVGRLSHFRVPTLTPSGSEESIVVDARQTCLPLKASAACRPRTRQRRQTSCCTLRPRAHNRCCVV